MIKPLDVASGRMDEIMSDPTAPETEETLKALQYLQEFDRVLPRSIEDWVLERERDGLGVPEILKTRLSEKARLREQLHPEGLQDAIAKLGTASSGEQGED